MLRGLSGGSVLGPALLGSGGQLCFADDHIPTEF